MKHVFFPTLLCSLFAILGCRAGDVGAPGDPGYNPLTASDPDPECKDVHPHVWAGHYGTEPVALKHAIRDCKKECCLDLCMCDETSLKCFQHPTLGWYCQGKDDVTIVPGVVEHRATCRDKRKAGGTGGGSSSSGAGASGAGASGGGGEEETCEATGGAGAGTGGAGTGAGGAGTGGN